MSHSYGARSASRMSARDQRHYLVSEPKVARGCLTKVAFRSKRIANGIRRVMVKREGSDAASLHVYRCRHCHHWHLGNSRWLTPPLGDT
jgi:hypothetical protein